MKKQSHKRRSERQWQAILAEYQQSHLTQKQYCKHHGIANSTFSKWKAQLAEPVLQSKDFIEISPEPPTTSTVNNDGATAKLELAITWLNKLELNLKIC